MELAALAGLAVSKAHVTIVDVFEAPANWSFDPHKIEFMTLAFDEE